MRRVIGALLVIGACAAPAIAFQARGAAGGGSSISACSLLTRDLVMKTGTAEGKRVVDLSKPMEHEAGVNGSACEYGGIGLQIDPFGSGDQVRTSPGKDWTPVASVGDAAFFRNNGNMWAELIVWTGRHHFTIQMGVPRGSTVEAIKPNTIALANEILPKLR